MVFRLMSDYKVELINDNMQEFLVEFHGPEDSNFNNIYSMSTLISPIPGWSMDSSCGVA